MNSQQTMYYYNGTVFPIVTKEIGDKIGNFHKAIVTATIQGITRNAKQGVSKTDMINESMEWLNIVEKHMCDIENQMGLTSEKTIKELCARCECSQDFLMNCWAFNVNTLLVLKALNNDNDNGVLFVKSIN